MTYTVLYKAGLLGALTETYARVREQLSVAFIAASVIYQAVPPLVHPLCPETFHHISHHHTQAVIALYPSRLSGYPQLLLICGFITLEHFGYTCKLHFTTLYVKWAHKEGLHALINWLKFGFCSYCVSSSLYHSITINNACVSMSVIEHMNQRAILIEPASLSWKSCRSGVGRESGEATLR